MDYTEIFNYLNGNATPEEQSQIENWMEASPKNKAEFSKWKAAWEAAGKIAETDKPDVEAAWRKVRKVTLSTAPAKRRSLAPVYRIAVAIILLISAGVLFTLFLKPSPPDRSVITSSGKIIKTELPDGSLVWLNRNSRLEYPESFRSDIRRVALDGEAFFEVTHDKERPFEIQAGDIKVKVLGTSFNVEARQEAAVTSVQVRTGKVALYEEAQISDAIVLEKEEEGIFLKKSRQFNKRKQKDLNYLAWVNRNIRFENTPLAEVARVLKEVYGSDLIFDDPQLANCTITAGFQDEPLENILQAISVLFEVKIDDQNGVFVISGKTC